MSAKCLPVCSGLNVLDGSIIPLICCSGIGLALAERLLQSEPDIRLCLACRNAARAAAAREALLIGRADADITLITMDTSSVVSVVEAAKEVKKM